MQDLIAHIKARNVETLAWIAEDPSNRWAGLYPEDEQHWIERGINTIEQLQREELLTYLYEESKSVYGYRPSMNEFENLSIEELKARADELSQRIEQEIEDERAREEANFKNFEERIENIKELVANTSNEDALRVLIDAEDETENVKFYGYESLEYKLGLAYGSIKKWLGE